MTGIVRLKCGCLNDRGKRWGTRWEYRARETRTREMWGRGGGFKWGSVEQRTESRQRSVSSPARRPEAAGMSS